MARSFPILRPFYYLDHFEEMLAFLEGNCAGLFGGEERGFIADFRGLGVEARAMVVRLANRSGSVFRVSSLKYKELPDVAGVLAVLRSAGFVREPGRADERGIVAVLTRPEIVDILKPMKGLSSKTKGELLGLVQGCGDGETGVLGDELLGGFIVQERVETLEFLFFLFFGKQRRNLQALALRDLGIVKTRAGQSSFEVKFPTREAAVNSFFYAKLSEAISVADGEMLVEIAAGLEDWPVAGAGAGVDMERDREICRLGARLEQAGFPGEALGVYRKTSAHPARERVCRILVSQGKPEEAERLLEEMISSPSSDEELLFAEDFHARKFGGRKVGRLTGMLRSAPVIEIDEAFRDSAEEAAANHFRRKRKRAYRTENHLWASLFGLLFWEELQGENGETKHNEFEHRPTQLSDGSFFRKNEAAIEARLELLQTGAALEYLEAVAGAHCGKANGVFRWRRDTMEVIRELLAHAPPRAVAAVLRRMAKRPGETMIGYPDLMVVGAEGLRFVEVKAEGDQIRRHQLVQLQALEAAGFRVGVVRVEWFADPDQEYVVVDIETTGGRAAHHRVTEIGAVRIRGGEVVAKYSTLLNPERRIPGNITRLTGISDSMVAGAPKFEDVADAFRDFVGNAVFVAHNASFDYGFLRQEFARIGEDFRRPTLCTVVAMRKFFPGLPSYSLGKLTEYFQVPLESHHRALCDAEATAELLKLINGKRLAGR
ncbi:exonuclease domain-containing protein [Luteolibacter algae]|uniref:Exonuclease domain-containing protein n=1 Tax=Luteolibacter algae TaxID=454151 RepID=A0ABW5D630_9BACT